MGYIAIPHPTKTQYKDIVPLAKLHSYAFLTSIHVLNYSFKGNK